MKKIKYLIFILPLLFITNVNAEECHNYFNLLSDDFIMYNNGEYASSSKYNINSSNSITLIPQDNTQMSTSNFIHLPYGNYIFSWVLETNMDLNPAYFNFDLYCSSSSSNPCSTSWIIPSSKSAIQRTDRIFKKSLSVTSNNYSLSHINFSVNDNQNYNYTLKDIYLFEESEYDTCIDRINNPPQEDPETPQETSEIDFSGLIPYLLLIASLAMLFIEINFIKSLLKSRR